jgi:hypothetical protein
MGNRFSKKNRVHFPEGDTLAVVLSFMTVQEVMNKGLFRVSREWLYVLTNLSHAWGPVMSIRGMKSSLLESRFPFTNGSIQFEASFNELSRRQMEKIGQMSNLRRLKLNACKFDVEDLKNIAHLQLQHLEIGHTRLTNTEIEYISSMPLKVLSLRDCKLVGVNLSKLASMPLEELSLQGLRITEKLAKTIFPSTIRKVSLPDCDVGHEALTILTKRPVVELELNGCYIDDSKAEIIGRMQTLQVLSIMHGTITNNGLRHLANLKLRELTLYNCRHITTGGLIYLDSMPLQRLNLQFCRKVYVDKKAFKKRGISVIV